MLSNKCLLLPPSTWQCDDRETALPGLTYLIFWYHMQVVSCKKLWHSSLRVFFFVCFCLFLVFFSFSGRADLWYFKNALKIIHAWSTGEQNEQENYAMLCWKSYKYIVLLWSTCYVNTFITVSFISWSIGHHFA